ncbi:hypothetical protein NS206_17875, partial [Microbacterium testaceum]
EDDEERGDLESHRIEDHDAPPTFRGKRTMKVVPLPRAELTVISPPCARTMSRLIASPRPLP